MRTPITPEEHARLLAASALMKAKHGSKVRYSSSEVTETCAPLRLGRELCEVVYATFLSKADFLALCPHLCEEDYVEFRRRASNNISTPVRHSGTRVMQIILVACISLLAVFFFAVVWLGAAWGGHAFLLFPILLGFLIWLFIQRNKMRSE